MSKLKLRDVKDMPVSVPVLAKLDNKYGDLNWYVIRKGITNERGVFEYEEASGEQYMTFDEDEIIGWVGLAELDQVITE